MYSRWAQCSRFGPGVRTWANTFQIHLAAMACLDIFQLVALPTDKDGGFCLVHSGVLREVHLQLFRSSWYKEVASLYASESFWKDNVVPPFIGICKRICKADPIPFKELTSSVNPLHTSSVLRNTVKTHKPNGQVKFRPVHASSKHCFSSASVWLQKTMDARLRAFPHLIGSTDEFLKRMSSLVVDETDLLLHMDLDDFFMTGSVDFISRTVTTLFEGDIATPLDDLVSYVLDHQYVRSPQVPEAIFKVVEGSGMGLRQSAGLSNACFCAHAEIRGVGLATQAFQTRFGIKCYMRYVDNLFFVVKQDWVKIRALVDLVKCSNSMSPYTSKVEEASRQTINFLDVQIFKGSPDSMQQCRILWQPVLKDTALRSVLGFNSCHPVHVHLSWMSGFIERLRRNSHCIDTFRSFKHIALERLRRAGVCSPALRLIGRATAFTLPTNPYGFASQAAVSDPVMWCPFSFHPLLRKVLLSAIHEFNSDHAAQHAWQSFFGSKFTIRVAWRVDVPPLQLLVR